jgi:arsenate reductase (glutaredoxin)
MTDVTFYHNPNCGTSRNTLALIRNAGIEPTVIEYLKMPPDRATLLSLIKRMGVRPRDVLREKGTPYAQLGLGDAHWTDDELIDQMLAHAPRARDRLSRKSRGWWSGECECSHIHGGGVGGGAGARFLFAKIL